MKIKMDYGREGLEIDVPDYSDILIPNHKNEISDQILTLSNSDVKSKNETLNLEILEKSSMVLVSLKELLENFYSMNSES